MDKDQEHQEVARILDGPYAGLSVTLSRYPKKIQIGNMIYEMIYDPQSQEPLHAYVFRHRVPSQKEVETAQRMKEYAQEYIRKEEAKKSKSITGVWERVKRWTKKRS